MVYPPQLTIQLRQRQLVDIYGNNIVFTGSNPLSLAATDTTIPTAWTDFTKYVQGLDKIALSWSVEQTTNGQVAAGQFVPQKGFSGTLTFELKAYDFIKNILVDDVAAPLNQIEVQITDITCGAYTGYVIKASSLSWCEFNAICTFDVNLKQEDLATQCIQRTMIADNWQGWFQPQPAGGKKHPRFSYCVEKRPNGTLILEWYITTLIAYIWTLISIPIYVFMLIVYAILSAIDAILGKGKPPKPNSPFNLSGWANLMFETAGCGREHPAPLIRDYISNVCDKCGIKYDATTADIFFAPMITIQKSDSKVYTVPNPHYNATLFFPQVVRGVRRFSNWNLITGNYDADTTTFYDPNNQPVWALSDMLDYVKKVYNSAWRVQTDSTGTPYLYFKRKDWFQNQPPLYDFSTGGTDRSKLIEGICYEPQDYTVPASMNGLYEDDASDKCGHEASWQMNGNPLSFNNTIVNPLFHGILDKTSGFGATKFNCDGASTNYLYDALQVVESASVLADILTFGFFGALLNNLGDDIREYADYAVLLQLETCSLPKIIIWDGGADNQEAYLNAKALKDKINIAGNVYTLGKSATSNPVATTDFAPLPAINALYPTQVPTTTTAPISPLITPSTIPELLNWDDPLSNPPKTTVIGRITGTPPYGFYGVINAFGTTISSNPAILCNYPMYFNPYYQDTLWDWFHWIDNPYANPKLHKNWNLKIPLCKEDIVKLGLLNDGSNAKLLAAVTLDCRYYHNGVITDIEVGYSTSDEDGGAAPGTGQYIQLKGYV